MSVFAGRIADTGRDPIPIMTSALAVTSAQPGVSLLWASPREILNVRQADDLGVDIITLTHDILAKLSLFGKDLDDYSLETVKYVRQRRARRGVQVVTPGDGRVGQAPDSNDWDHLWEAFGEASLRQPRQRLP